MTEIPSPPWAEDLPAPLTALLELGLTVEQVEEAAQARPLVVACQAHRAEGAEFDVARVKRALRALRAFKHTTGRWAGKSLDVATGGLAPWQVVWIIVPVFGWVRWDDEAQQIVRVVRTVWVEVPRKNGKSTISAGLANILFLADDEPGAEVYAAAGSLVQAGRVYEDAKRMLLSSPPAAKRVEVLKEVMRDRRQQGIFRVLSRVAEAAHGLNVSGAVIDEIHVHKNRGLIDAIETGTGARAQPLVVLITTADEAVEGSIYDEKHAYTRKVASAIVSDPTHYGVIWAAEDSDDPFAEQTWRKANPGLGVSPSLSYIRKEAERARTTPSYLPTFKQLHLDLRTRAQRRLIDLRKWDACGGIADLTRLKGCKAWGGLDLSAVSDLTAWCMVVESPTDSLEAELLWRYWVPEDRVVDLERQLQVPLSRWVRDGFITATEGDVIDYDAIEVQVAADAKHLDMKTVAYDRMFAGQMVQRLDKALRGCELKPVAQTFMGTSPGIKELLRLLGSNDARPRMRHAGDPVSRWMASVVEGKDDGNDNLKIVKPERGTSQARIDGIAAAVMGLDGYLRRPLKRQPITVYRAG
jgi:Phage terminase-like protein, large subunit